MGVEGEFVGICFLAPSPRFRTCLSLVPGRSAPSPFLRWKTERVSCASLSPTLKISLVEQSSMWTWGGEFNVCEIELLKFTCFFSRMDSIDNLFSSKLVYSYLRDQFHYAVSKAFLWHGYVGVEKFSFLLLKDRIQVSKFKDLIGFIRWFISQQHFVWQVGQGSYNMSGLFRQGYLPLGQVQRSYYTDDLTSGIRKFQNDCTPARGWKCC